MEPMTRALVVCLTLLTGIVGAQAGHYDSVDYDLIQPNGHPRSEAVHKAAIAFCLKQTGDDPDLADTPQFKKCLLGRGYRVQSERWIGASPAPVAGGLDGTYVYDDASPGPERSEKDEERAARLCNGGDAAKTGTQAFNACMLAKDWQFSKFEPARRPKAGE
jgi:hypothetical protein